jgi:hypothetical protein
MLGAIVLALILLLIFVSPGSGSKAPLTRSCVTPAIALSTSSTGAGRGIGWAVTGPDAGTYVITVGSRTIASLPRLPGCRADGTLPPLTRGEHRVELLRNGQRVAVAQLAP